MLKSVQRRSVAVLIVWLLGVSLVLMLRPADFLAISVIGAATLGLLWASGRLSRVPAIRLVQIVSALAIVYVLVHGYYWATWDPGGLVDDGWGRPVLTSTWSGGSESEVLASVDNGRGSAAVALSQPGLVVAPKKIPYFVRLHTSDADVLILRYTGADVDRDYTPSLKWLDPTHLRIAVRHQGELVVTKMRRSARGVTIEYDLGQARYELDFWQRPFW